MAAPRPDAAHRIEREIHEGLLHNNHEAMQHAYQELGKDGNSHLIKQVNEAIKNDGELQKLLPGPTNI